MTVLSDHGTNARWQRHYRDGEEPCDDCKIARAANRKRYPESDKSRELRRWHVRIRHLAVKELIRRYRPEYLRILHELQEQHRATQP